MRNPISLRHTVHATWLLEVWHNVLTRVKYLILWKEKKLALSLTSCAMFLACKQVANHPPHSLTLNHKKKKISERVANYFPRLRTINVYVYMYIYVYIDAEILHHKQHTWVEWHELLSLHNLCDMPHSMWETWFIQKWNIFSVTHFTHNQLLTLHTTSLIHPMHHKGYKNNVNTI